MQLVAFYFLCLSLAWRKKIANYEEKVNFLVQLKCEALECVNAMICKQIRDASVN